MMIKNFLNYELYSVSIKVWLYALLAHSLGVPVLLMLFGMAPANAFELAGFFMLVYNVVGGIAVAYILVIWGVNILVFIFTKETASPISEIPSIWYLPKILIASYILYYFVHFFMIRDMVMPPSPREFVMSYFDILFGVLSSSDYD